MQNKNRMNTTFQKRITVPSVLFILLVSLISGIFPSLAGELLEGIRLYLRQPELDLHLVSHYFCNFPNLSRL